MKEDKPAEPITCMSYNPDRSCIAVGTSRGFKIYSINPFELRQHRDFAIGIGIIEMVNRSNLVGIVGLE